jgi:hypothetical protein
MRLDGFCVLWWDVRVEVFWKSLLVIPLTIAVIWAWWQFSLTMDRATDRACEGMWRGARGGARGLKGLCLAFVHELRYADPVRKRFLIPAIIAAVMLGAAITWAFTSRYYVFPAGGGVVMKVDRWTGETWQKSGRYWETVR